MALFCFVLLKARQQGWQLKLLIQTSLGGVAAGADANVRATSTREIGTAAAAISEADAASMASAAAAAARDTAAKGGTAQEADAASMASAAAAAAAAARDTSAKGGTAQEVPVSSLEDHLPSCCASVSYPYSNSARCSCVGCGLRRELLHQRKQECEAAGLAYSARVEDGKVEQKQQQQQRQQEQENPHQEKQQEDEQQQQQHEEHLQERQQQESNGNAFGLRRSARATVRQSVHLKKQQRPEQQHQQQQRELQQILEKERQQAVKARSMTAGFVQSWLPRFISLASCCEDPTTHQLSNKSYWLAFKGHQCDICGECLEIQVNASIRWPSSRQMFRLD